MSLDGISLLNLLSSGALTWGSLHTLAYSSYHAYEKRGTPPALVWGIKALVCLGFALQSNTSVAVYYQYLGPACYGVGKVNTISFHVAMICVGMVLCSRLGSMMGWGKVATKIFLSLLILQRIGIACYDIYATYNYDDVEGGFCNYHANDLSGTLSLCSDILIDLCCTIGFVTVCTRYLIKAGSVSDLYAVLIESNVLRSTVILCANVVQLALMYTVGTATPWMTTVWNLSDILYMYAVCYDSDLIKVLRGGGSTTAVSGPSGGRPSTSKDRGFGNDSAGSYAGGGQNVKVKFEDSYHSGGANNYGGRSRSQSHSTRGADRDDYYYDDRAPKSPVNAYRSDWAAPPPSTPTYKGGKVDPYPRAGPGPYNDDHSDILMPTISGSLEDDRWMDGGNRAPSRGDHRAPSRGDGRRDDYGIPMNVIDPYPKPGYSPHGQQQGYGRETPGGLSTVGRPSEDGYVKEYAGSVKSSKSGKSGKGGYGGHMDYTNAPPLPDERVAPAVTGYPTYRQTPEYAKEW